MTDHHVRSTCRLCGAADMERLLQLPPTPLANSYPETVDEAAAQARYDLHLVGCKGCGHVQLPVVVDPKVLFPPNYAYQSGTSAVFREHLRELAETIDGAQLTKPFVALDVACNDGTLVQEMGKLGIAAFGVDPCAPEEAEQRFYWRGFFGEQWARWAKDNAGLHCDVITALNVFAHVDDLDDFTRGVKTLLEPCGLFVIEVGYLPDVVKRGAFDTIYHEHLSYHHLSPLVRFFRRHGMTMVDAHRIDSQGGSVRIFVRNCDKQHVGGDDGHNEPSARLQDLLDEESRSELWEGVRHLSRCVRGWRDAIKGGGDKVAVYGAPAKLCTLLHATDMAEQVLFVVDDNPLKVGRYVPGTRIPIKPVSALYEWVKPTDAPPHWRPQRVVIASWNFAEDIKKRHAALTCRWV